MAVPKRGDFVTEIVSGDNERYFAVKYDGNKELLNLDELREDVDTLSRDMKYILYECPAQANNMTFAIANICMQDVYNF